MNTLIVHSHPEATSFNAALKDVATGTLEKLGHRVEISDLFGDIGMSHYTVGVGSRTDLQRYARQAAKARSAVLKRALLSLGKLAAGSGWGRLRDGAK